MLSPSKGSLTILFTFLVSLLLTILPMPEWTLMFRPQWSTLVLIYWALALPHRIGVGIGWLLGIILDVLTGALLGQHAISLALIAFITHQMHLRVRLFPLWQQSLTVLVLLLLERMITIWIMGVTAQAPGTLLYWAPPLVGMLLWPWIYIILRDLRRKFQVS